MGLWDAMKDAAKALVGEEAKSVHSIPSAVRDSLRIHGQAWLVSACSTKELTAAVYHLVRAVEELEREVAEMKKQKR